MAKGSTQTYGGWEKRNCFVCGAKLTHKTHAAYNFVYDGESFSTCRDHIGQKP